MSSDASSTLPAAGQDPCCGTAEQAAAADACCAPDAKAQAVTEDAGCCGPADTVSAVELLPTPAARPAATTEGRPEDLPVVVIGAGPVGLAAAAHLHEQDVPFVVLGP